jgi:hypothetical protein
MSRLFWRQAAFFSMSRLFEKPAKMQKAGTLKLP